MKKFISVFTFIFVSTFLCAQVNINGVDINQEPGVRYVKLLAFQKFLSNKVIIAVDYGQKMKFGQGATIKDADGKDQVFNSVIGALNFMEENGWEYVNDLLITTNNQNVYHYLMKKKE